MPIDGNEYHERTGLTVQEEASVVMDDIRERWKDDDFPIALEKVILDYIDQCIDGGYTTSGGA